VGGVKKLVAGTINGATIYTTGGGGSMGSVSARKIVDSELRSKGNIGALLVSGSVSGSRVFAGVGPVGEVTAEDAAKGKGQIVMARVGSGKRGNVFADSAMAAKTIKDAVFGNIVDAASGEDFYGVRADVIKGMSGYVGGKAFAMKNASTQGQVDQQLKKGKVGLKNVRIEVV
jgi:hypothetical protein